MKKLWYSVILLLSLPVAAQTNLGAGNPTGGNPSSLTTIPGGPGSGTGSALNGAVPAGTASGSSLNGAPAGPAGSTMNGAAPVGGNTFSPNTSNFGTGTGFSNTQSGTGTSLESSNFGIEGNSEIGTGVGTGAAPTTTIPPAPVTPVTPAPGMQNEFDSTPGSGSATGTGDFNAFD